MSQKIKKFILWFFRIAFQEVKELFAWIIFRSKKIKNSFLNEFYPSKNIQTEATTNSNSEFWHEEVLDQFRLWLEEFSDLEFETLKQETKSETESPTFLDIYSEITALKQNYQRQTKSDVNFTKTFQDELKSLRKQLEIQNNVLQTATSNFNAKIVETRINARKEILTELLYIHESLERCILTAEKEKTAKTFWRRKPDASLVRIKENQKIVLEKSLDALRRLNVQNTAKIGQLFDPKMMKAVAIANKSNVEKSTVTKVLRQGYAVDNKLIQTAEVEVNK